MGVDVAAILRPSLRHELAPPSCVPLVPCCQIAHHQLVDVAHMGFRRGRPRQRKDYVTGDRGYDAAAIRRGLRMRLITPEELPMPKLRIHNFTVSLDGYGAGPDQDRDNPFGRGGLALHGWMTKTHAFQRVLDTVKGRRASTMILWPAVSRT